MNYMKSRAWGVAMNDEIKFVDVSDDVAVTSWSSRDLRRKGSINKSINTAVIRTNAW